MIDKMVKSIAALSIAATMAFGAQGVMFNVVGGNAETKYNTMVNEKIKTIGFILSDPHERINDAYATKYGSKILADGKPNPKYDPAWAKNLDNLGFFSVSNDLKIRELLLKYPELGGFSPFNFHIYKAANEDKTYVGHIVPQTMLDIVGIKDEAARKEFIATFTELDAMVAKEIGGTVQFSEYKSLPAKPMMQFEITFDRPADLSSYLDSFQEQFEAAFEKNEYIIAGFKNYKDAYTDKKLEFSKYDAYFTYSLCHFTFSYNIFNKGRPDAGAFAPCSMYMYIPKGTNKLVIGMPRLANWTSVLNIEDKTMQKSVTDLDADITKIMLSLGAKEL